MPDVPHWYEFIHLWMPQSPEPENETDIAPDDGSVLGAIINRAGNAATAIIAPPPLPPSRDPHQLNASAQDFFNTLEGDPLLGAPLLQEAYYITEARRQFLVDHGFWTSEQPILLFSFDLGVSSPVATILGHQNSSANGMILGQIDALPSLMPQATYHSHVNISGQQLDNLSLPAYIQDEWRDAYSQNPETTLQNVVEEYDITIEEAQALFDTTEQLYMPTSLERVAVHELTHAADIWIFLAQSQLADMAAFETAFGGKSVSELYNDYLQAPDPVAFFATYSEQLPFMAELPEDYVRGQHEDAIEAAAVFLGIDYDTTPREELLEQIDMFYGNPEAFLSSDHRVAEKVEFFLGQFTHNIDTGLYSAGHGRWTFSEEVAAELFIMSAMREEYAVVREDRLIEQIFQRETFLDRDAYYGEYTERPEVSAEFYTYADMEEGEALGNAVTLNTPVLDIGDVPPSNSR